MIGITKCEKNVSIVCGGGGMALCGPPGSATGYGLEEGRNGGRRMMRVERKGNEIQTLKMKSVSWG